MSSRCQLESEKKKLSIEIGFNKKLIKRAYNHNSQIIPNDLYNFLPTSFFLNK